LIFEQQTDDTTTINVNAIMLTIGVGGRVRPGYGHRVLDKPTYGLEVLTLMSENKYNAYHSPHLQCINIRDVDLSLYLLGYECQQGCDDEGHSSGCRLRGNPEADECHGDDQYGWDVAFDEVRADVSLEMDDYIQATMVDSQSLKRFSALARRVGGDLKLREHHMRADSKGVPNQLYVVNGLRYCMSNGDGMS